MSVTKMSQLICFARLGPSHRVMRGFCSCVPPSYRTSSVYRTTSVSTRTSAFSLLPNSCFSSNTNNISHNNSSETCFPDWKLDSHLWNHGKTLRCLLPQSTHHSHIHHHQHHQTHLQQTTSFHHQSSGGHRKPERHFMLSPKGLLQAAPEPCKPYMSLMRMDKPIGTWLLYLPCMWSISLAAPPGCLPDISMLALFGLGAFIMRGAGCTINDMWDKDYDKKVVRTKDRPLAAEQINYLQAWTFLGAQLSSALLILLTMNWNTVFLGVAAMVPVVVYPLMKRVTYWPQAFLGITLNWGVLLAWTGLHGNLELPGVTLYLSCVLWTMIYDTIYSHQDKEDDLLIGVKSTALRFGDDTKKWLLGFSSVMLSGLTVTGVMSAQTWPYFLGVGGVATHLLYQILTVDLNDTEDCGKKFRSNRDIGLFFWLAIVMANVMKDDEKPAQVLEYSSKSKGTSVSKSDRWLDTTPEDPLDWPEYFMAIACLSAQRSKDPASQVGACIVNDEQKVVGIGYNCMPNGCHDDVLPWARRADDRLETKYLYVCHAEMNAILYRSSADVKDCSLYVTLFPCNECAKLIIQSGIKEVIYISDRYNERDEYRASRRLLDLAGVRLSEFIPKREQITIDFTCTSILANQHVDLPE